MKLYDWVLANEPDTKMFAFDSWWDQIQFLRGHLRFTTLTGVSDYEAYAPQVISTHKSKSVIFPVVEYARPDLGLRLIVRGNLSDWKMSVISETPIKADLTGLFQVKSSGKGDAHSSSYFEGFPEDLIFGFYEENPRKFSAHVGSEFALWTSFFLILRDLAKA